MKNFGIYLLFVCMAAFVVSCESDKHEMSSNPFDVLCGSDNSSREKIVVISDLHLGNDPLYSENIAHLGRLEQFLKEVRTSNTVKELVLAGDILDEWYVPTRLNTYGSGSQADFVKKSVAANQRIFDEFNAIIKEGKIKLTYVPGNHDMGFLPENVDIAMPGVNQARDGQDKFGVGTYNPEGYPQIAIEHSHRYDFFCSMTPGATDTDAPGAKLPPGYFFARIAANSFTNPTTPEAATKVPDVTLYDKSNPEQYNKYLYYTLWKTVIEKLVYIKDNFSDPIFTTNMGGYTGTYSVNDILPYNREGDNAIEMKLFNDQFTQAAWERRSRANNVTKITKIDYAIVGSLQTSFLDNQSFTQYFNNEDSGVRVVVFGHTHKPMIKTFVNEKGEECVYANSGTWEDKKSRDKNSGIDQDTTNMNFVVLSPVKLNKKKLQVGLFQYYSGNHMMVESKVVNL